MMRLLWSCVVIGLACSTASAQVNLERKYVEGSTSVVNMDTTTHQVLTIDKTDVDTRSHQFIVLSSTVGKRGEDGLLPVDSKISTLQSELRYGDTVLMSFDSGNPDKKADNPQLEPLLEVCRAAARGQWTTIFDRMNQVKTVENKGTTPENIDASFKSQFDPEVRKKAIVEGLATLPEKPVTKGDKWVRRSETDLGAGQKLALTTEYEYRGPTDVTGKMLDEIAFKSTEVSYVMDAGAPSPLKVKSSTLKVTGSTGRLLFDRDQGAVVESSSSLHIQGELQLSVNGNDVPGKLDLTIDATTKLQPK